MKFRTYVFVFLAALAGSVFLASCLNEENKIPPNCYDGELNNGENPEGYVNGEIVMFDCGGPNCEPCDHCANNVFEPWLDEEWRDCGGECDPCEQCNNGIKDGDEEAVDCGGTVCGPCGDLCGDGLLNGYEIETDCIDGTDVNACCCTACPTCDDGEKNGLEWGIDCGGPECAPCCATGNCGNGYTDGQEFNTDCGGLICDDCGNGMSWVVDSESYSTPSAMVTANYTGDVVTFTNCPAFEDPEYLILIGNMTIYFTGPFVINGPAMSYNIPVQVSTADFGIVFTDELGEIYSSSNVGGSGVITITKVGQAIVPDSDLDECNKPAGTYDYFRGSFHGVLANADLTYPTKECESGSFQFTQYTP
jgi:hypothetical protein